MGILVVDQGPEIFWFASGALVQDEIQLKHLQTVAAAEAHIFKDLPKIVILNGDDSSLEPIKFIGRMRNHVFARNILFIVFTADLSNKYKKELLMAGAGQVFYKGRGFNPSPSFFASLIKWFLTYKAPDPQIFEFRPTTFAYEAEFTTWGRVGWISSTHLLLESNLDINPGQSLPVRNSLFEELEIKDTSLVCEEKNKVGRYYQYANSMLCKIVTKDPVKDAKKITTWIGNNRDISKDKSIKIVYFESDPDYREIVKQMIKLDKRYCARGYSTLEDLQEILDYQMPQLVMVNRALILSDKAKFDPIKNYVKNNFCYVVTYALDKEGNIEEFKKDYEFAMHSPMAIELPLLESMVMKLAAKLPEKFKTSADRVYFGKHNSYSRINLHGHCNIKEMAISGINMVSPFALSNYCACELTSTIFQMANIERNQLFRSFSSKQTAEGNTFLHRLVFMGQNVKDNENVKSTLQEIAKVGFDNWIVGDKGDKPV